MAKYMLIMRSTDEALANFEDHDFDELLNGYYILDLASKDEAVEWAKRLPFSEGAKVEIRRIPSIDEFPQDNEWIQKERAWREATGQL
jgi:hypothetical protein